MKVITNASAKVEQWTTIRNTTLANAEALAKDAAWQATLAGIREQYPNGVMHP
jgi:hypothetical protein